MIEAGGTVTDLAGGERFLETGNVVAGNLKLHAAMIERIAPFLGASLRA